MQLRYTDENGKDRSRFLQSLVAAHRVLPGFIAERASVELAAAFAKRMGVAIAKWSPHIVLDGKGTLELQSAFEIRRDVQFRIHGDEYVRLGNGVAIDSYTILEPHANGKVPGFIEIGAGSFISTHCYFSGDGGLRMGKNVGVGAYARIAASTHHYGLEMILNQPKTCRGITIGDGVWLASHVSVLDGVTIGEHSVIGAGSVVRDSIPPNSLAVGAPARVVKTF